MPTEALVADRALLAQHLLTIYGAHGYFTAIEDDDESLEVGIQVYIEGADLRPALAVMDLVQLCADAAAIAVEIWDGGDTTFPRSLYELAAGESLVELRIVDLGLGSFLAKLSVNPKTPTGRRRLRAIATLLAFGLTPFLGPGPGIAVAVVGSLDEIFTPDSSTDQASSVPPTTTIDKDAIANAGGGHVEIVGERKER
jgi:hypothetical protein